MTYIVPHKHVWKINMNELILYSFMVVQPTRWCQWSWFFPPLPLCSLLGTALTSDRRQGCPGSLQPQHPRLGPAPLPHLLHTSKLFALIRSRWLWSSHEVIITTLFTCHSPMTNTRCLWPSTRGNCINSCLPGESYWRLECEHLWKKIETLVWVGET